MKHVFEYHSQKISTGNVWIEKWQQNKKVMKDYSSLEQKKFWVSMH